MEQIQFTDDKIRPSYDSGEPIPPVLPQITIRGTQAYYRPTEQASIACDWACSFFCSWEENNSSPSPVLDVQCYYMINSNDPFYGLIRVKVDISDDNFSTIKYSKYIEYYTEAFGELVPFRTGRLSYQSRDNYQNKANFDCNKYAYLTDKIPLDSVCGSEYQVRLQTQTRWYNDSSWRNAGQPRIFSSYAPFYLNITKPEYFYLNRLNTFCAVIEAQYISTLSVRIDMSNSYFMLNPVRNDSAPYVTSGQRTTNIYCLGTHRRGTNEVGLIEDYTYSVNCTLKVVDPSDSNYVIKVCSVTISGDCYWHSEDDRSMYNASATIFDPSGIYEQYNYFLTNTDSRINYEVVFDLKYGALAYVSRRMTGKSYYRSATIDGETPIAESFYIPLNTNTFTLEIFVVQNGYNETNADFVIGHWKLIGNILEYYVPSFPDLAVHRCDEDGELDDNGDHCRIEWATSVAPIANQNSKALVIDHSDGTTVYDPLDNYIQTGILIVPANTESSYRIVFTLTDDFNSESRTLLLSSAGVIMDWLRGGKGVSFGKVASKKQAVEVGEMWKLICYNLFISNTDVAFWMSQIAARVQGIERYIANLGNTDQFQVTIYNDDAIMDRQWIRSGMDAREPDDVPSRESTKQYSYSFVGWTLTKGGTTDNPNAFKNITALRNIYAAYTSVIRSYRVEFYNGKTLLEAVENVQYGTAANRTSSATPTGDGTFFAFLPKPSFVEGNMRTYATFYKRSVITDDWDVILEKCNRKTAGDTYFVGQYKPLTLTNGTTVNARIMGIRQDEISGINKAEITWMLESVVGSSVPFNLVRLPNPIYHTITSPDTLAIESSLYHTPEVGGSGKIISMSCAFKFTKTASERWSASADNGGAGRTIKIYQDGTLIFEYDGSGRKITGFPELTVEAGAESIVSFEFELVQAGVYPEFGPSAYIYTTSSAYNKNAELLDYNGTKEFIKQYENGTGAIGGWEYSNLRTHMNENILPLLPENIRDNIKTVKKTTPTRVSEVMSNKDFRDATSYLDNVVTSDKIWAPSIKEIMGAESEELLEYAEYGAAGSSVPASSGTYKWLRDTGSGSPNYARYYYYSSYKGSQYVDTSYAYNVGFCT